MKNIIFVCTGNTCRSPMAEAIAKEYFYEQIKSLNIYSRGIAVYENSAVSLNALEALKKYNLDISEHISKQITKEDIEKAYLILTMSKSQKDFILNYFPQYKDKVYTLFYYSKGIEKDISDPYGGDLDIYTRCCDEIYNCIHSIKYIR